MCTESNEPACSDLLSEPTKVSESEGEGEEEGGEERRGSLPFLAARRGSKLQDLLKYNQVGIYILVKKE